MGVPSNIVSQASPIPFCSTDRFQYQRCRMERGWLTRLPPIQSGWIFATVKGHRQFSSVVTGSLAVWSHSHMYSVWKVTGCAPITCCQPWALDLHSSASPISNNFREHNKFVLSIKTPFKTLTVSMDKIHTLLRRCV